MRNRLLRPFLMLEFLIALEVALTFWSQVGGQYHLDLMYWPWKFGLSVAAAALITAITADLARGSGAVTRRVLLFCSLLIATIVVAGVVTYYYHLNEPQDEDRDNASEPARVTGVELNTATHHVCGGRRQRHPSRGSGGLVLLNSPPPAPG
jgi:hypothetical protein